MQPQPAAAQDRVIGFRLNSSTAWDANVFRVPKSIGDPQLARGIGGRSDQISTTSVGLGFNKAYAQQQLQFDVNETATRYRKFSFLNRNALNYSGAWRWHVTPRISGVLSMDRAESIVEFEDSQIFQRNITVTTNRNFSVDGWLFGGWHVFAGASETERENSLVFQAVPSDLQTNMEFGLRYEAGSGSSITATRRTRKGTNTGQEIDPVNFIDNEFSVHEIELGVRWAASARTSVNGRLSSTERRHAHVPQRDFSGIGGELGLAWLPTGKLSVNVSAARAVVPFIQGIASSYRVDDTLSVSPAWRVSDRVTINASASQRVFDFRGPVVPGIGPSRRDTSRSMRLAANWTLYPKVTLSASVQRDLRTSTDVALTFDDTVTSLSASLAY